MPETDRQILKAVLQVLNNCDGHAVGIETLQIETNAVLDGEKSAIRAEVLREVRYAQDKGWVDYTASRIDRSSQWYITAAGRLILREDF